MDSWEQYYLNVIYRKKKGITPFLVRTLLWIVSFFFQLGVFVRNKAYDSGLFCRYAPPGPIVVSIGNIVAGGVGKTPVTILLAEYFYDKFPIAILSRGYRSEAEKMAQPLILSRGFGPLHPASMGGDEPYLMAERLPKAFVIVGRDRKQAADTAARLGAKIIFLDDGMQHRRLERDFEVVVIDATDPWGLGHFLPRGLLREGKSALKRADLVILNHAEEKESLDEIRKELSRFTSAPIVATEIQVEEVVTPGGKKAPHQGSRVALFSSIAKPTHFIKTVQKLGYKVVGDMAFNDHEQIDFVQLAEWGEKMKVFGAEALLCTEKDFVKCPSNISLPLPLWWIRVKLGVTEGEEVLVKSVDRLTSLIKGAYT